MTNNNIEPTHNIACDLAQIYLHWKDQQSWIAHDHTDDNHYPLTRTTQKAEQPYKYKNNTQNAARLPSTYTRKLLRMAYHAVDYAAYILSTINILLIYILHFTTILATSAPLLTIILIIPFRAQVFQLINLVYNLLFTNTYFYTHFYTQHQTAADNTPTLVTAPCGTNEASMNDAKNNKQQHDWYNFNDIQRGMYQLYLGIDLISLSLNTISKFSKLRWPRHQFKWTYTRFPVPARPGYKHVHYVGKFAHPN
jgi:hypothetical protein